MLKTKTDEDGKCTLIGLPDKLLPKVSVTKEGFGSQIFWAKNEELQLSEAGSILVKVLPDEPIDVSGSHFYIETQPGHTESGIRSVLRGELNGPGECRFEHAVPGNVIIRYFLFDNDRPFRPDPPKDLVLEANSELTIKIPIRKTVVVRGTITAGGVPVPNTRLTIHNTWTTTDDEGKFELRTFPGSRRLQLTSISADTQRLYEYPKSTDIVIQDKQPFFEIETIELPLRQQIEGNVIDLDGRAVSGFHLAAQYEPFGHYAMSTQLNDDGSFKGPAYRKNFFEGINDFQFYLVPKNKEDRDEKKKVRLKVKTKKPLVLEVDSAMLDDLK